MVFNRHNISEFTAAAVESATFNGVYHFYFSGNGLNIRKHADVSRIDPIFSDAANFLNGGILRFNLIDTIQPF